MRDSIVDRLTILRAYQIVTGNAADGPVRGGEVRVQCPSRDHHDEHPSCDLNTIKNSFFCRSCGVSGGVLDLPVTAGLARSRALAAALLETGLSGPQLISTESLHNAEKLTRATVAGLAKARRLDEPWLRGSLGLSDVTGGVRIPYDSRGPARARVRPYLETAHPTLWSEADAHPQRAYVIAGDNPKDETTFVEGETDSWTLWSHGIPAVGIPGATMTALIEPTHVEGLRRILVVREPGAAGATFVDAIHQRLRSFGYRGCIAVVDLRASCDAKDPSALHVRDPQAFEAKWARATAAAPALESKVAGASFDGGLVQAAGSVDDGLRNGNESGRVVRMISAETILPVETRYIVEPYIPCGEATWFEGETKSGKTFAAIDIIARVTKGLAFVTGAEIRKGRVAIMTCEDDPARTIIPRLEAAGADRSAVSIVRVDEGQEETVPSFLRDLDGIERALRSEDTSLIFIDGTFGMLGATDGNSYIEAFETMIPFVRMVRRLDIGAIIVRHVRKTAGSALHRGIGSIGFASLARSTVSIAIDRDDDTGARRLFAHAGTNLARTAPTLSYTINDVDVAGLTHRVGRVAWGGIVEVNADEAMVSGAVEDSGERSVAEEFLLATLAAPMLAADVFVAAYKQGIPRRTLQRAAKRIGVTVERRGFGKGSFWSPPMPEEFPPEPIRAIGADDLNPGAFGGNGANAESHATFPRADAKTAPLLHPFHEGYCGTACRPYGTSRSSHLVVMP